MWLKMAAVSAVVIQAMCAQTWEITPYASYLRLSSKPLGSMNAVPLAEDTKVKGLQPGYGLRVTANTDGYYGLELGYSRSKGTFSSSIIPVDTEEDDPAAVLHSAGISLQQASLNGIYYFMPNGERIRPYVTGGAQFLFWSNPQIADGVIGKSNHIGVNYGGGVKIQLLKNLNMRLEVRGITSGSPYKLSFPDGENDMPRSAGLFTQLESSIGFGFTF